MPVLTDLPQEIRDKIYVEALVFHKPLVAVQEQIPTRSRNSRVIMPHTPLVAAQTPLLEVNHAIHREASAVFYARNTFRLSSSPVLERPSVFTKHAPAFRRISLVFIDETGPEFGTLTESETTKDNYGIIMFDIWKRQIQMLAPMINLQLLELDVTSLSFSRIGVYEGTEFIALHHLAPLYLKPELNSSLPLGIRKNGWSLNRGIWVTGANFSILSGESRIMESWEDLGVKVARARRLYMIKRMSTYD